MQKINIPKIRLSVYGCLRAVENTITGVTSKFDWRSEVADAGILAAITFFSAFGGFSVIEVPTAKAVLGAAISAGSQFFIVLGFKRKLIKTEAA